MARPMTPGKFILIRPQGYVLLTLLLLLTVMSLGLMVAVPVWQTQIQREKEEELIFRGKQYVEAVRIYQLKHPGRFPAKLEDLLEEKCIRRLWPDPMTSHGRWDLILLEGGVGGQRQQSQPQARRQPTLSVLQPPIPESLFPSAPGDRPASGLSRQTTGQGQSFSPQKVLIVPQHLLGSIKNPQILGVVSSSSEKSIRLYNDQESYDQWLFYYGQDPQKNPEIVHYQPGTKLR